MNRPSKSSSNRPYRAYHQGDFYDGLPQADKVAYTEGTIPTKSKRRVIPEHILKLMAQPDKGDEIRATLGLSEDGTAIQPSSLDCPKYYIVPKLQATATCYVCGTLYKLSAIKYHKAKSLEPEQPICTWCYRALKANDSLAPSPTPGNRAAQGFTGTKTRTLVDKLELAWLVLATNIAKMATSDQVYGYITELAAGPCPLIELYFDKNDKLMADQRLVEDFIDQLAHPSEDADLEEYDFTF